MIPSALERYAKEANRVAAVLGCHLGKQKEGEKWLVGGQCSYADIAFILRQKIIGKVSKRKSTTKTTILTSRLEEPRCWSGRELRKVLQPCNCCPKTLRLSKKYQGENACNGIEIITLLRADNE